MSLVLLVLHNNKSLHILTTDLFVSLWMVHTPKIFCFSMDYPRGQSMLKQNIFGVCTIHILFQHGLPQGSVIGPLGFVFYTHTVGRIIRCHQLMYHIYADDIQIYLPVDHIVPGDLVCGMLKISRCVEDINSWMMRNKLKLNPEKN